MDPFFIVWIAGGIICFLGGAVYAGIQADPEILGPVFFLAGAWPALFIIGAVVAVLSSPYLLVRYIMTRRERKLNRFKNLDTELDKHIEETRKLINQ